MVVFYSREFSAAAELLQWICVGMALRIISWPMGYIIVAKGENFLIVATELAWMTVNLLLTWALIGRYGLTEVGIAFFGSYVFHAFLNYVIVRRQCGFQFSTDNVATIALMLLVVGCVFSSFFFLSTKLAMGLGSIAVFASGFYGLVLLSQLVNPNELPQPFRQLVGKIRALPYLRAR